MDSPSNAVGLSEGWMVDAGNIMVESSAITWGVEQETNSPERKKNVSSLGRIGREWVMVISSWIGTVVEDRGAVWWRKGKGPGTDLQVVVDAGHRHCVDHVFVPEVTDLPL